MAKFNNIIKWIFLIGFSTTLVMQVAGDDDDKTIVGKVNTTLGLIKEDFENLGKKIASATTVVPSSTISPSSPTTLTSKATKPTTKPTKPTTKPTKPTTKPTKPTTKPTKPTTKPTKPTTKPTAPTTKPTTIHAKTTNSTTKPTTVTTTDPKQGRKKRDVLSQIWEMKMRKMQNKLATSAPPTAVTTLTNAMANVTTVTADIVKGTINEDQVTTVEDAEKDIKAVVKAADANLISYMKNNPKILEDLRKKANDAASTVKKYYDDNFEDDGGANVGAIVGGVCGGVAGVGLLGFGYYYYKKKQS